MKVAIQLLLAVVIIGSVKALIMCPPGICDRMKCKDVSTCAENGLGFVKEKGGFCGCCDACITYLPKDGNCFDEFLIGTIQKTSCLPTQYCKPSTRKCTDIK